MMTSLFFGGVAIAFGVDSGDSHTAIRLSKRTILARHARSSHEGSFWWEIAERDMRVPEYGHRGAMKIGSNTWIIIALFATVPACGISSVSATDFCIELTGVEFNRGHERRGDENACAGDESLNIKDVARDRARNNANNAIASQCLRDVTHTIGQQACARVNLVANTSPDNLWGDYPPAARPSADNVRYIGRGVKRSASVNLCAVARDVRIRTRSVVDGHCPHDSGLLPHRIFATARARARCAVICSSR
jgi:hypothetical protein